MGNMGDRYECVCTYLPTYNGCNGLKFLHAKNTTRLLSINQYDCGRFTCKRRNPSNYFQVEVKAFIKLQVKVITYNQFRTVLIIKRARPIFHEMQSCCVLCMKKGKTGFNRVSSLINCRVIKYSYFIHRLRVGTQVSKKITEQIRFYKNKAMES